MIDFIRFVYKGLLTGMPILTYNSFNKNTFNIPMTVNPISTYVNGINMAEYPWLQNKQDTLYLYCMYCENDNVVGRDYDIGVEVVV